MCSSSRSRITSGPVLPFYSQALLRPTKRICESSREAGIFEVPSVKCGEVFGNLFFGNTLTKEGGNVFQGNSSVSKDAFATENFWRGDDSVLAPAIRSYVLFDCLS